MENVNLFALVPPTPEPIVARVRAEFARGCREVSLQPPGALDRLADADARQFWDSQVRMFGSVRAPRQARGLLGGVRLNPGSVVAERPTPAPVEASAQGQDEPVLAEWGVLTLGDDGPALLRISRTAGPEGDRSRRCRGSRKGGGSRAGKTRELHCGSLPGCTAHRRWRHCASLSCPHVRAARWRIATRTKRTRRHGRMRPPAAVTLL